jgi:hypothetical protein
MKGFILIVVQKEQEIWYFNLESFFPVFVRGPVFVPKDYLCRSR